MRVPGILSPGGRAAVGDQVDFGKSRPELVPLGEGADRDLVLEPGARAGGGQAVLFEFTADRAQLAVHRGPAHGEQQSLDGGIEDEFAVRLQDFQPDGQEGVQAIRTEPVAALPHLGQGADNFWPVDQA